MASVMSLETALEGVQKLTALGRSVQIRPRSFNTQRGTNFWALEVAGVYDPIYSEAELNALVEKFTPPLPPIYVRGSFAHNFSLLQFKLTDGSFLADSYGTTSWNLADLRKAQGSIKIGKQEYRLLPPENLFAAEPYK